MVHTKPRTIKLGLGDFVIYSLIAGRAASVGVLEAGVCVVVILVGLIATLTLLAVSGKALPALPVSVAFAVVAFVVTEIVARLFIMQQTYTLAMV
jgi:presenilin 1